MAKTKISEFSSTPANNTDIDGININEGCAPSGINDAIRELMAQLKDWQSGTSNDPYVIGSSGSLTLNQGTANGVLYLDGSKVATSGSALVFDGSALGIGATPSAWGGTYKAIDLGTIGSVSSTSAAMIVGNNFYFDGTSTKYKTTAVASRYNQTSGSHTWQTAVSGTAGDTITFTTSMVLDTNSNLGLGGSASSLWSGWKVLQVGSVGALGGTTTQVAVSNNWVSTSITDKYIANGYSNVYTQVNGEHLWYNAPSGTAGSTITFTQAMTLNASGNLGIGTSSPSAKLDVAGTSAKLANNTSADVTVLIGPDTPNAARSGRLGFITSSTQKNWYLASSWNVSGALEFTQTTTSGGSTMSGTPSMILDSSGNLGIGTTSPAAKLDVRSAGTYTGEPQAVLYDTRSAAANVGGGINFGGAYTGTTVTTWAGISGLKENVTDGNFAGCLSFFTRPNGSGASERMRLDSSGNLGLGVTPSAWNSARRVMQVGGSTSVQSTANNSFFSNNYYTDAGGTDRYINTSVGQIYAQLAAGGHAWYNAPSGTAGNAITFTQAMTLDASGNLGVGVTSPTWKLTISDGTTSGGMIPNSGNLYLGTISNHPLQFRTNNTDRMTLNASGQLGVGTTTPDSQITINGASSSRFNMRAANTRYATLYADSGVFAIASITAIPLVFGINDVEKARIDSSGNLLVGKTSSANSGAGLILYKDATFGGYIKATREANSSTQYHFAVFDNTGGSIGSISSTTTATAYNTSSDYRLKNSVFPMTGALSKVALLKPCTYKWNADGSDGEGFIAHELAEVCPQAVTGEKDAVDDDGNPKYQGIDTSFLVATLTAALQELNAKFDAYVASHP